MAAPKMRKDKAMSRKPWLWLLCLGLAACANQPKTAPNILLPQENRLQAASVAPTEQWYQAEWFWQGRSLAFLMLLQNEASGGHTLVAISQIKPAKASAWAIRVRLRFIVALCLC